MLGCYDSISFLAVTHLTFPHAPHSHCEVQACPYIFVLTPTILSMSNILYSTINISFVIWSDPVTFFSVCSLTGFVHHEEFISTPDLHVHLTECTRFTDLRFLFASSHERHTALHKSHPHLTLPSMNDSTGFTAGHLSASTLPKPHARHPSSATAPLATPACHLFVDPAPRRCATARSYRHFRPLCTSQILQRLLTSLLRRSSAASNSIWAGHKEVGTPPCSSLKYWAY